jgi:hypothetical protein
MVACDVLISVVLHITIKFLCNKGEMAADIKHCLRLPFAFHIPMCFIGASHSETAIKLSWTCHMQCASHGIEPRSSLSWLFVRKIMNTACYCDLLKDKLKHAVRMKRRWWLAKGAIILHDNARPHSAQTTGEVLGKLGWEVLSDHPYSQIACLDHLRSTWEARVSIQMKKDNWSSAVMVVQSVKRVICC